MIDVVIPVKETGDDNEELRYALRSIDLNLEYSGKVWLVGHRPSWYEGHHIHRPQSSSDKLINVRKSLLAVCKHPDITARMIWCNDDFFIMRKLSLDQLNVYRAPINDLTASWQAASTNGSLGGHAVTVYRTGEYLKRQGIDNPLAYDSLHWPQVFDRTLLGPVVEECYRAKVTCWATVYGNYHRTGGRAVRNSKRADPELWPRLHVLSSMDSQFEPGEGLGEFIRQAFPYPSHFENDRVNEA